ncbi:MAG: hypothetical protein ACHBNF_08335 [Chromatiales bacterium]
MLALAAPARGQPSPPDFSGVDDVLLGRRLMLPVQDLVLGMNGKDIVNLFGNDNAILPTQNGMVSGGLFDWRRYVPGGIPLALASGRMFELPNDVIATLARNASAPTEAVLNVYDPLADRTLNVALATPVCAPSSSGCVPDLLAMGDLTGDGYAEIVIGFSSGGIQVASAVDPTNFASGLQLGDVFAARAQALAVFDVQGDGPGEIAAVVLENLLENLAIYTLDPSLDIQLAGSASFAPATQSPAIFALQGGQFDDDTTDRELVVAYDGANEIELSLVQVGSDLTPSIADPQGQGSEGPTFAMAVGRVDWFGDADQIVLLMQNGTDQAATNATLAVVVESQGVFTQANSVSFAATTCGGLPIELNATAIALGDFDFDEQNPETTPPNLDIGLLVACIAGDVRQHELRLYAVDPGNGYAFTLNETTIGTLTMSDPANASLIASDTQGRSLLLGPPQKVVITQHSQPRIVMGAPPMHIDYVQQPVDDPLTFDLANMTAFPATDQTSVRGMDATFSVASSSTVQNQVTQSTSYTYSTTTGSGGGVTFGVPDTGSIGANMTSTVMTSHDNLVANKFGTYGAFSYKIDVITGFGDVLWFDTQRFNIWTYPVLGHLACPATQPTCDTKLPLNMTFSGPDQIQPNPHTPGTTVEWYQPFHEVGNILSYPQSLLQLEEALGAPMGFQQFFDEQFTTGSADASETLNWMEGNSSDMSTGTVTTHSQSQSQSVSVSGLIEGSGITGSASFTENSSDTITTLNTAVQTTASTSGFNVSVPGFDLGEAYSYPFDGFILGDAANPDVLQTELKQELEGQVDLTINGTLRLAFTAQPDAGAGNWWQNGTAPYLSAPDVALNHPFRWSLLSVGSGPLSSVYCFNILDSDDVQSTGGYEMKGLFILPNGAVTGPQLTLVNEGDTIQLSARVYNYSRLDMAQATPPVAHVKVQFYGQQWDTTTQQFVGDAFLINNNTVSLDPIAGNNVNNTGLNAAIATTTFDTATCPLPGGCGGVSLKFWIVVWMEDASGNLVPEYQDHGLNTIPTVPFTSLGQVDVEPISNNVGYYDQDVHICPQGSQCTVPPGGLSPEALAIEEVTVSCGVHRRAVGRDRPVKCAKLRRHQTAEVGVRLTSGPQPIGAVLVIFYDGDPANGGEVFEVEHVPFIAANKTHLVKVRYQPRTPGTHDIVAVVHAASGTLTGTHRVKVAGVAAAPVCQNPLTPATRLRGLVDRIGDKHRLRP